MAHYIADYPTDEEIILAGRRTAPGRYRELGSGRLIELDKEDTLPASLDGRVACYVKVNYVWGQWTAKSPVVE